MATAVGTPLDSMEEFHRGGLTFVCSTEQLPDGLYHPVVRYRFPPSDALHTLSFERGRYCSPSEALLAAKERAVAWVIELEAAGHNSDREIDPC